MARERRIRRAGQSRGGAPNADRHHRLRIRHAGTNGVYDSDRIEPAATVSSSKTTSPRISLDRGTGTREAAKAAPLSSLVDVDGSECPICLEPLHDNEAAVLRLPCDHALHRDCAGAWMLRGTGAGSSGCPLCRAPVPRSFVEAELPPEVGEALVASATEEEEARAHSEQMYRALEEEYQTALEAERRRKMAVVAILVFMVLPLLSVLSLSSGGGSMLPLICLLIVVWECATVMRSTHRGSNLAVNVYDDDTANHHHGHTSRRSFVVRRLA
eukprot:CAMPEP_0170742022 /NCGR_PEP_ID=MMETSP0437-20130122/6525_1 /TAXON_ID=0 /ORGANISM="Sexangularia sp." /LENGTH=270 /DNA_ID=CAMNT_0011080621 /DNA_START=100 /DNA_END=912 /DNA_ORIENTATION=-